MMNRQDALTSSSSRQKSGNFATNWIPSKVRIGKGKRKKDPVNTRQRKFRMKRMSQKVLLWLLLPVVIISLGGLAYSMLLRSDILKITAISVKGNQVTTKEQILKTAGLRRGINLLALDIPESEALIRKEQWIDQVWINRQWPSTVEVIVQEYKPFALINLERDGIRQLYYMDKKGIVFAPSTAERDLDYPVVNGPLLAEYIHGKQFSEGSPGALALELLKLTAQGNQILPTQAVSEINIDPEGNLIVYLVDHPFPIHMGNEQIKVRFYRLVKVLAKLYQDEQIKGVSEIRMDYSTNKILVARIDKGQ